MDKERFLFLLRNFESLTTDEASELVSLKEESPYSQIIHSLAARAAQDNRLGTFETQLNLSAVYSTDRALLKSLMSTPRTARKAEPSSFAAEAVIAPVVDKKDTTQTEFRLSGDELLKEVMNDLSKLREAKHKFELKIEEFESKPAASPEVPPRKRGRPPKEIKNSTSDSHIEEIKTTKKKTPPETTKQQEQTEIINRFINAQPSIPKAKPTPVDPPDLTEKSLPHGENAVSETLVEVLLKQGKKDKAIEVLKKLIWKFPQKKAYFAAQIEELKK